MDWLLDPIANVLGFILTYIDKIVYAITDLFLTTGIHDTGTCIIIFTFVVNIIMIPLSIKQQKTTKLSAIMNPEIQAIQAKYKGKKDNVSMQKMQMEQQAVYDKYGVSPFGGCLPLLIQMPILFALYGVIREIDTIIPALSSQGANMFFGIDLGHQPYAPWNGWDRSFLIPVLAVVTQFLSSKLMSSTPNKKDGKKSDAPGGDTMKMMNTIMPLISGVFCLSFDAGIGIYWIAGNVFRCVQSIVINRRFDKMDFSEIISKNQEKASAKASKREIMNQRVSEYSKAKTSTIKSNASIDGDQANKKPKDLNVNKEVKPGSISGYATMLSGSKDNKK